MCYLEYPFWSALSKSLDAAVMERCERIFPLITGFFNTHLLEQVTCHIIGMAFAIQASSSTSDKGLGALGTARAMLPGKYRCDGDENPIHAD